LKNGIYKRTSFKGWEYWEKDIKLYSGVYPVFRTKEELKQFCKRKRKMFYAIFLKAGDLLPTNCKHCNNEIIDSGNRVKVFPKQKLLIPLHYDCAWSSLFGDIFKIADKLH